MCLLLLLVIPEILAAQSLQISDSAVSRKETGSFLIRLETAPDTAPVSLQWEMSVPKEIEIRVNDVLSGSSAESAGKSITCMAVPEDHKAFRCRCILAGGAQPLKNGPVAIVRFRVSSRGRPGDTPIKIEKALGVSKNLKQIRFPEAEGKITIR